jgi:hypothetical protein
MSVSGKLSSVKQGDVVLEKDGYMRMYFRNTNDVWFEIVFSKENKHCWVSEAKTKPYIPTECAHVMNVADLLFSVKAELANEPSN